MIARVGRVWCRSSHGIMNSRGVVLRFKWLVVDAVINGTRTRVALELLGSSLDVTYSELDFRGPLAGGFRKVFGV